MDCKKYSKQKECSALMVEQNVKHPACDGGKNQAPKCFPEYEKCLWCQELSPDYMEE